MSKKIAYVFPGQGSQFVGMGKDFYDSFSISKDVYEKANEVLKKDITSLCFNGDEESLKQTINTQPCIVTTEIAILMAFVEKTGIEPYAVAGHSLGEYAAYFCSCVLDFDDTMLAIQKRAEEMSKVHDGKMAAVITDEIDKAKAVIKDIENVWVANYNSLKQIVITGENNAIDKAIEKLTNNGFKKVIPLAVSGAFHSPFMKNSAEEFSSILEKIKINDARIPVYTNVDGCSEIKSDNFKKKMKEQIYSSVYWTQTIQNMVKDGVEIFVELGPGKVLSGLIKKTVPDVQVYSVYDIASFEEVVNEICNKEKIYG